jgi:hypothetical protein
MSNDFSTTVANWLEQVLKGGQGSGEGAGHPFRGNRYTNGVNASKTHDTRAGTEKFNYGQHLDSASQHVSIAKAYASRGEYGLARTALNEAAYHSAQAAKALVGVDRHLGNQAKSGYTYFHHAANLCEVASKAVNDYESALRSNASDPETLATLRANAEGARSSADASVNDAFSYNNTLNTLRISANDPTIGQQRSA